MSDTLNPAGAQPSAEAEFLRKSWNPEILGRFEGQWIAVRNNEIIMAHPELAVVASETIQLQPLYAFVTFKGIQV